MNQILLEILFPDYKPPHEIIRQTYDDLLRSIRPVVPEVHDAARKAWDEGHPIRPALAGAIHAWGEQIRAEEHKTQEKLDAHCTGQEKQIKMQAQEIEALRKELSLYMKQANSLNSIITEKEETLKDQRNLLAKQHEQLARLSGLPKDE